MQPVVLNLAQNSFTSTNTTCTKLWERPPTTSDMG